MHALEFCTKSYGCFSFVSVCVFFKLKTCAIYYLSSFLNKVIFFFGKLTYVLKEEDKKIIRGIPQIYNENRNIKQQMATG